MTTELELLPRTKILVGITLPYKYDPDNDKLFQSHRICVLEESVWAGRNVMLISVSNKNSLNLIYWILCQQK